MKTLLERIEDFMREHEMSESRFGELAINDRKLVSQIRGGRDLRTSTVERINAFMADFISEKEVAPEPDQVAQP